MSHISLPSFSWSEYLTLAEQLSKLSDLNELCIIEGDECKLSQFCVNRNKEAKMRSAISRAYYSVFCKARNYLRDRKGHNFRKRANVHWYVINEFKYSSNQTDKNIGIKLERLREYRNKADYEDQITNLPSVQQSALFLADTINEQLNSII